MAAAAERYVRGADIGHTTPLAYLSHEAPWYKTVSVLVKFWVAVNSTRCNAYERSLGDTYTIGERKVFYAFPENRNWSKMWAPVILQQYTNRQTASETFKSHTFLHKAVQFVHPIQRFSSPSIARDNGFHLCADRGGIFLARRDVIKSVYKTLIGYGKCDYVNRSR